MTLTRLVWHFQWRPGSVVLDICSDDPISTTFIELKDGHILSCEKFTVVLALWAITSLLLQVVGLLLKICTLFRSLLSSLLLVWYSLWRNFVEKFYKSSNVFYLYYFCPYLKYFLLTTCFSCLLWLLDVFMVSILLDDLLEFSFNLWCLLFYLLELLSYYLGWV